MYTKLKQKDGKRSKKTILCSRKILNFAFTCQMTMHVSEKHPNLNCESEKPGPKALTI